MYKPHEFAKLIGVSVKTLQRWDNEDILIAHRNPKNRRYYTEEQLDMYLSKSPVKSNRKIVMCTRVSNGNQIDKIFITYKDRFVRFGYEWFEDLCKKFNTEIIVLNNKELSPAEEMTEDLISIIDDFGGAIESLRKYKKAIADDKNL